MPRPARNRLLAPALLLAAVLAAPPLLAAEPVEPPPPAAADREALAGVVAEHRVETSPPRPSLARYAGDLARAFFGWIDDLLEHNLPGVDRRFGAVVEILLYGLTAVVMGVLVYYLARLLYRRRRRGESESAAEPADEPEPAAVPREVERWEAELRRRLGAADAPAAVEALWWWLATFLMPAEVQPSWTSRELVTRAGRPDLAPQVRHLDRLIYGAGSPTAEAVRRLHRELREALV
jgi:hypothetical protein